MKDELGGNIMTNCVALSAKMYAYRRIGKRLEAKSCKCTEKCLIHKSVIFDYYETCLFDKN